MADIDEQHEKKAKKYFEKLDEVMSPISKDIPESKRSLEENKKVEYLELLQNDDNKKLIEQYLNKMGVKENSTKHFTFTSTKEKVYQKILDQQSKNSEDTEEGNYFYKVKATDWLLHQEKDIQNISQQLKRKMVYTERFH